MTTAATEFDRAGHAGWREWRAERARERRRGGPSYQLRLLAAVAAWKIGVLGPPSLGYGAPEESALDAALYAYFGAATLSALGDLAGCVWRDADYRRYSDLRAAGRLGAYAAWKRDGGEGWPPEAVRGLDRHLGAACNAADCDTLSAGVEVIRNAGARPPGLLIARWRHRGAELAHDAPELARIEPGPSRAVWRDEVLVERDDDAPEPTAAPLAATGSAA